MVSIGAALLAIICFVYYIQLAVKKEIGDLNIRVKILQATRDIPPNTRIDESMFMEKDYPKAYLPPRAATQKEEVIGQVAIATIFEGEPILTSKIIPFDESSLDRRIPDGYRAITIGIRDDQDVIGVGGQLRPGHFVDILLTLFLNTKEIEKGSPLVGQDIPLKAETRTIFQNIRILAVGRDSRLQTANVNRPTPLEEDLTNKNVTLAMRPDDVQKIVLAQATGRITLSLRRFNDADMIALEYLDPFKAFGIKLPIVAGPPPAYREIRGGQVIAQPF
ncbi:MAG: cpaB [Bacteriovoracaceae bacterium]|nr:cpaB [Bacteriovoracaceae bacterium]